MDRIADEAIMMESVRNGSRGPTAVMQRIAELSLAAGPVTEAEACVLITQLGVAWPTVSKAAFLAIWEADGPRLCRLIERRFDESKETRPEVAVWLAALMYCNAEEVPVSVSYIRSCLLSSDPFVLAHAVATVECLGDHAKPLLPDIWDLVVRQSRQENRSVSIHTIGALGVHARPLLPVILSYTKDAMRAGDLEETASAVSVLGRVGWLNDDSVDCLEELLGEGNPLRLRKAALSALCNTPTNRVRALLRTYADTEESPLNTTAHRVLAMLDTAPFSTPSQYHHQDVTWEDMFVPAD